MFLADAVVETHDRLGGRTYREAARACEAQLGDETAAIREALRAFAELGTALLGARDAGEALDAVIADGPGWEGLGDLVAKAAAFTSTAVSDPLNHVLGRYSRFRRSGVMNACPRPGCSPSAPRRRPRPSRRRGGAPRPRGGAALPGRRPQPAGRDHHLLEHAEARRRTVWRRRGRVHAGDVGQDVVDPPADAPVGTPGRLCVRLDAAAGGGGSGPVRGLRVDAAGRRGHGDLHGHVAGGAARAPEERDELVDVGPADLRTRPAPPQPRQALRERGRPAGRPWSPPPRARGSPRTTMSLPTRCTPCGRLGRYGKPDASGPRRCLPPRPAGERCGRPRDRGSRTAPASPPGRSAPRVARGTRGGARTQPRTLTPYLSAS